MHAEMLELMHRILDGDSPAPDRARLEGHLAGCADCSRAWASLQAAHTLLADAPPQMPPIQLRASIARRLARERGVLPAAPAAATPGLWTAPVRWERARLAAALALLALLPAAALGGAIGWLTWQSNGSGPIAGVPALRIGGAWEGWSISLSGVLAFLDWGAAWTTLLGTFTRTAIAVAGTGSLLLGVALSLAALAVWAYLLDAGAARLRLGRGIGGQS